MKPSWSKASKQLHSLRSSCGVSSGATNSAPLFASQQQTPRPCISAQRRPRASRAPAEGSLVFSCCGAPSRRVAQSFSAGSNGEELRRFRCLPGDQQVIQGHNNDCHQEPPSDRASRVLRAPSCSCARFCPRLATNRCEAFAAPRSPANDVLTSWRSCFSFTSRGSSPQIEELAERGTLRC